jgi:hypothetical protein
MCTASRSLARLPLQLFENLSVEVDDDGGAEKLRAAICTKLKSFAKSTRIGLVHENVQTVGALLEMPTSSVLRALDPLLTFGESDI